MEMITVILLPKTRKALSNAHPVGLRHPLYLRHEAVLHLLLLDATYLCVVRIKRYVLQLIEVTEDAHFAELCHPREEHEFKIMIVAL